MVSSCYSQGARTDRRKGQQGNAAGGSADDSKGRRIEGATERAEGLQRMSSTSVVAATGYCGGGYGMG